VPPQACDSLEAVLAADRAARAAVQGWRGTDEDRHG